MNEISQSASKNAIPQSITPSDRPTAQNIATQPFQREELTLKSNYDGLNLGVSLRVPNTLKASSNLFTVWLNTASATMILWIFLPGMVIP